jgi:hypothetical protein
MSNFGGNYTQGTFVPKHPEKCLNYNGKMQFKVNGWWTNQKPITYRSSWELKVCNFCDTKANVIEWGSEIFTIDYINQNDGQRHRYVTDFYIKVRKKSGEILTFIAEVKPDSQSEHFDQFGRLIMPDPPKHKTQKSMMNWQERCDIVRKNNSKWNYAREWCKHQGFNFIVLNESNIGIIQ